MNPGVPSRTALGVARRRAAHQVFDDPVVFRDPLAERMVADLQTLRSFKTLSRNSRSSRLLRAFIAARSRYAEDELAIFFARGVRQYVVLGAGLDTFAYRNPYAPELRVFEVDHPDTQAWKIERLRAAGIRIPGSLSFVPVNFERQRFGPVLEDTPGFNGAARAFFSWLGVTPYLTRDALLMTLRAVGSMPENSAIVLDYAVPAETLDLQERIGLSTLAARVARIGEPFQLFLEPPEISAILHDAGFTRIEDLGQQEINARYFEGRTDGLRIGSTAGRILSATVDTLVSPSRL